MYAVIRTGGKQYRVEPGHEFLVEKHPDAEPGKPLKLDDVLLYSDGKTVTVGQPTLPVTVHCFCVGNEKGRKVFTVKYKRRKNYRRTMGHRQTLTRLRVEKIEARRANGT